MSLAPGYTLALSLAQKTGINWSITLLSLLTRWKEVFTQKNEELKLSGHLLSDLGQRNKPKMNFEA